MVSLKSAGPILILFLVVIGGIYAGVFSAMEGGGIGAFCAFLIALVMKRLSWKTFWDALLDGGKLISTLLLLIGSALVFGNFLAAANLTAVMSEFVNGLAVSPLVIVACILFVFLILGCLIDAPVIMLLFVPILVPVAETMGIDLLWFGILIVLMANLGAITPPYALIIFLLRGLSPDIPVGVMYRGVLPFVLSTLVVVIFLFFFPVLITWLPNILMR
jgi:tripartite ATP-independent transporter DctM subunit